MQRLLNALLSGEIFRDFVEMVVFGVNDLFVFKCTYRRLFQTEDIE